MWMNEGEVEDAADLFTRMGERQGEPMPNCVKGAEILQRLVKWTNRNSDGWPYWNAPAKAATKLMDLLHEKGLEYRRSSDVVDDITDAELKKAVVPIKTFLTKRGVDHAEILEPPPQTIPLNQPTQRFYQGAAVGDKVTTAHADLPFPDHKSRLALFYFYAGALAVGEYGCKTNEDFEPFLVGLATRAPQVDDEEAE